MAESRGVAILVGAGDAIGAAVARRFARGGYTVCICRRDAAKSQGLVSELRAAGHNIHAFSVDARQEAEVQGIFARSRRSSGPSRSASSTRVRTSTSLCWTPPKSCSSRRGNWPAMAASWSDVRLHASCCRADAAPSSLRGQRPVCVAARGLRHFHQRSSDFAQWLRRWRASWDRRTSTSCIS